MGHVTDMTLKQLQEHCVNQSGCDECAYGGWCGGNAPCEWDLPKKEDGSFILCTECGSHCQFSLLDGISGCQY